MNLSNSDAWAKLTRFLTTNPEIVSLQNRYHELTGYYLPGWNWNDYHDLNHYVACLREIVAEAEAEATTEKEKTE